MKMKVKDFIIKLNDIPKVNEEAILKEAFDEMETYRLGIVMIVGKNNKLKGVITDGDIRRLILKEQKPMSAFLSEDISKHTNYSPKTANLNDDILKTLNFMNVNRIYDLPVIDQSKNLIGLVHLHLALERVIGKLIK